MGGTRAKQARVFWALEILAVFVPLAVYWLTLCPTISTGDSGELVTGAYRLGIVHPPGYPLYCLFGRLFALLPAGGVAQQLNLFSALCAALSAGLIFFLTNAVASRAQGENELCSAANVPWASAALLAGWLCAFSGAIWSQAVVAEVYTFHLFLLLVGAAALLVWRRKGDRRCLLFFAFIFGLSLSHHSTALLAAPAFLSLLLWHRRGLFAKRTDPLFMLGLLLLGMSVYLYLPLRALAHPPLDWGHPVTPGAVWAHLTRASYGQLSKNPRSWDLLGNQLTAWALMIIKQLGPILSALGLAGLAFLLRREKDWAVFTLVLFLASSFGLIWLLNFSVTPKDLYLVRVFFLPAVAMLALWAGLGAGYLGTGLLRSVAPGSPGGGAAGMALAWVMPLLAILPLRGNFAACDRSGQTQAERLGKNIFATAEANAVVFTSRDTPTFSLAYARIVQGIRPDVSLQHSGRANIFRWLTPLADALVSSRRPLYGITPEDLPAVPGWSPQPVGIVYRLCQGPIPTEDLLAVWERYDLEGLRSSQDEEDFFLLELVRNYAAARGNLAQELARRGQFELAREHARAAVNMDTTFYGGYLSLGNVLFAEGDYRSSAEALQTALQLAPEKVDIINNFALALARLGDAEASVQLYQRSLRLDPAQPVTCNALGLVYKQMGQYEEAAGAYRRAMELDAGYPDPLRNLGVIYAYHLVDRAQAIELWERYLSLRPDDPDSAAIRSQIERLRDALESGKSMGW